MGKKGNKKGVLHRINIIRHLLDHLMGEHHNVSHRFTFGGIVMITGVLVAKSAHGIHFFAIQVVLDALGYSLHGVGLVPFIDHLSAMIKQSVNDADNDDGPVEIIGGEIEVNEVSNIETKNVEHEEVA